MRFPATVVEEFGQRVLQERQRAGPIGHLTNQRSDDSRVEGHGVQFRRARDRMLQLGSGHRCDDLGPVTEQLTEISMLQWPIVEVGSQGDDDTNSALLVGDGAHQVGEEAVRRRRVHLCVQLLELVDQQQQLRTGFGQHPVDRTLQSLSAGELLEQ